MTPDELIDGWQEAFSEKDPQGFAAVCAPGGAAFGPLVAAASRCAVMRLAAGAAAVLPGDGIAVAVAACCADALPDDGALASALGEEAGCAA